jgi:hypothetical protein
LKKETTTPMIKPSKLNRDSKEDDKKPKKRLTKKNIGILGSYDENTLLPKLLPNLSYRQNN